MVLPGEGGKDGFHGSSKLSNTMPPPPKENFESCNVIYCCHKKAMIGPGLRNGTFCCSRLPPYSVSRSFYALTELSKESTLEEANIHSYVRTSKRAGSIHLT